MKKFLFGISMLFVVIVSCNPVDEDQLPPSSNQNLTANEVLQLLQGTWYLEKVELIFGPTCAGGENEIITKTCDLNNSNWKIDFTQNISSNQVLLFGFDSNQIFDVYVEGGNSTRSYSVVSADATYNSENLVDLHSTNPITHTPSDVFICFDVGFIVQNWLANNCIGYGDASKVVQIDSQNLVLECYGLIGGNRQRMYLKRSQLSGIPPNQSSILGSFRHDNTKTFQSGVLVNTLDVENGHVLTFGNEIVSANSYGELFYRLIETPSLFSSQNAEAIFLYGYEYNHINPVGPFIDEWSQGYSITGEKLCVNANYNPTIIQLTSTELVLRRSSTCNDYEEYHFTKVN